MKIISIGPAHPLRGGIARFNESLSSCLKNNGHEVELISFSFQYPSFLFPGRSQFSESIPPEGLTISSRLHSLSPLSWKHVADEVIRRDPELVIMHYWMPFFAPAMSFIAGRIKKRAGITIILLAHNLIPHERQPGTIFLTRRLLGNVSGLVALSASVVSDAKSVSAGIPAMMIPHPVYDSYGEKVNRDEALGYLGLEAGKKYILFFGLVRKYKGLDLLIKALPLVQDPDVIVLVAGEFYDKREEYQGLIDKLDLGSRIIIRDEYIPDDEVKYYFSAASLVVQPYRSATQSGVTQIAYHFEVPMVVSDVGGLPEIVEDGVTGYVIKTEPEAVAGAINRYFSSSGKNELEKNVRRRKEDFSWQGFVRKLLSFAEKIQKSENQDV